MNARRGCVLAAMGAGLSAAYALTPPSDSDGPIKLLACVVTPAGILEAEVDSSVDERMTCDLRCNYELGERMFSHTFTETIPARFQGRVGQFETNNAKAGSYSGEVLDCQKVSR